MTVIALSGRRIDAPGAASPRFPARNVEAVRTRVRSALERLGARILVCSAACGADLAALEAAGDLALMRRVILPFAESRFLRTSVIDRGVEWQEPFERVMAPLRSAHAVVTLEGGEDETESYAAADAAILDEAEALGRSTKTAVVVMVVAEAEAAYDGMHGSFAEAAKRRGLPIVWISTQP